MSEDERKKALQRNHKDALGDIGDFIEAGATRDAMKNFVIARGWRESPPESGWWSHPANPRVIVKLTEAYAAATNAEPV